jgi:Rps23 Pro-64 3,4-dihydroxylase Tpa1-like proline 4-hydroxylase
MVSTTREADARLEVLRLPTGSADARCPHLIFRHVLGTDYVQALLKYVFDRQADFQIGDMHNRLTGERFVDPKMRIASYLHDLGAFGDPIRALVDAVTVPALKALNLIEPAVEPKEFLITAYPDGGYIGEHIDTQTGPRRVRILSCVYYFAATPHRFSGGELRLYGFPQRSAPGTEPSRPPFVELAPETDSLIFFPSWLRHEVLPVRVPSGAWADSRFTINCWIHRAEVPSAKAS